MASPRATLVAGALAAAYPVLVYAGLRKGIPMRWMALALLAILALRWGRALFKALPWPVLLACVAGLGAAAWIWSEAAVLYYPVAVNLALLTVFAASLWAGPPVIERLARLHQGPLDEDGVRYTRRVTQVWCGFFALNGVAALVTALHGDRALWALYNGCLAYVLMGLLFAGEYLVRRRAMAASARRRAA